MGATSESMKPNRYDFIRLISKDIALISGLIVELCKIAERNNTEENKVEV